MPLRFARIYAGLDLAQDAEGGVTYSVAPVDEMPRYFVGKGSDEAASILISVTDSGNRPRAPIRLENLEVQFNIRALVRYADEISEGVFTIIRCRSNEVGITEYFLTTAEAIVGTLGADPTEADIARAVNRLTIMFQRLRNPPTRSIMGLFGELFVIHNGRDHPEAIRAWRIEDSSRFDFARGDVRLDAKTTSGRVRIHTFSYDQCNPPPGTFATVASLFAERLDDGVTLRTVLSELEESVRTHPELVLKLHETVAMTLGSALNESLGVGFDLRLARASLRFFDLREIPAIRGELPGGVGNVHFQSDLSGLAGVPIRELERRDAAIACFLPSS